MRAKPAEVDLCSQVVGGWPHSSGLQHPKGVYFALGPASERRDANLCENPNWQDHHT